MVPPAGGGRWNGSSSLEEQQDGMGAAPHLRPRMESMGAAHSNMELQTTLS